MNVCASSSNRKATAYFGLDHPDQGRRDGLASHDPSRLGPYELRARLGEGNYGVVYLAEDPAGDPLAVKLIKDTRDRQTRQRFDREVDALRAVDSKHVVRYVDHGEDEHGLWLGTVWLKNTQSLARSWTSWDGTRLLRILLQMLVALRDLHGAGVTHRDLHPGNVLVDRELHVTVVDLGLSLHGIDRHTASTEHLGQLVYTPPEQRGVGLPEWNPASDVYAWAATSAFVAQRRPPQHLEDVFAGPKEAADYDLRGVERDLRAILRDCLERSPGDRLSTDEVLRRLRALTQRWEAGEDGDLTTHVTSTRLALAFAGRIYQSVDVDPVFHRSRTRKWVHHRDREVFDLSVGEPVVLKGDSFTCLPTAVSTLDCPSCDLPAERSLTGFRCLNHLWCPDQVVERMQVMRALDHTWTEDIHFSRFAPDGERRGARHEGSLPGWMLAHDGADAANTVRHEHPALRLQRFTGLPVALGELLLQRTGTLRSLVLDQDRVTVRAAVLGLAEAELALVEEAQADWKATSTRYRFSRLEFWGLNNPVHELADVAHLLEEWRAPVFTAWAAAGWLD